MIRTSAIISWRARGKTLALAFVLTAAFAVMAAGLAHAVPTTFTVTNTNDSGPGSLRQAIADANSNANPADVDTIEFDIPAAQCAAPPTSAPSPLPRHCRTSPKP